MDKIDPMGHDARYADEINQINPSNAIQGTVLDKVYKEINKRGEVIDVGIGDTLTNKISGIDYKQYQNFIDGKIDRGLYQDFLDKVIDNPNLKATGLYKSDPFWLLDPSVLYRNGNYYRIIPNSKMSKIEILNAMTRFFIYLLILYIIFGADIEYYYIPLIGFAIILLLYFIQKRDINDTKQEEFCRQGVCNKVDMCRDQPEPIPL